MAVLASGIVASMLWTGFAFASEGDDGTLPAQSGVSAQQQEDDGSDPEANLPFLFAVYMITWAGYFAYAFLMSRRQREMQRELDALKAAIAEKEAASRPSE